MNEMCYTDREKVYRKAAEIYGVEMQLVVAVEELSEVTKELCKQARGMGDPLALAEEVADAAIMLEQVQMIFGIGDEVSAFMDNKVMRLKDSLGRK